MQRPVKWFLIKLAIGLARLLHKDYYKCDGVWLLGKDFDIILRWAISVVYIGAIEIQIWKFACFHQAERIFAILAIIA
jgi:hypothetical protein